MKFCRRKLWINPQVGIPLLIVIPKDHQLSPAPGLAASCLLPPMWHLLVSRKWWLSSMVLLACHPLQMGQIQRRLSQCKFLLLLATMGL